MLTCKQIVENAFKAGLTVPSFNVPYLPMVKPVVEAVADTDSFALIATARLEWFRFEAEGLKPVIDEYRKWEKADYVRLHLDHVPVIDEDDKEVDYIALLEEAVDLGYDSVMVDGSRLKLGDNIDCTAEAVGVAHAGHVACEAELGAVMGHEAGPMPPYEEIFASGKGFTDIEEARRFVKETECDWLSVAIGNIHGAVQGALRDQKKVEARLNIEHLKQLRDACGIPLVLHGGSGVQKEYLLQAIRNGIAKVNVGTEIRQAYEIAFRDKNDVRAAQAAVFERTRELIKDWFEIAGTRKQILEP